MQTFVPFPCPFESVICLDNVRLGKQRVEGMQILNALSRNSGGWVNHPAVRMWRGYEEYLKEYINNCIIEWTHRGFKNTMEYYPESEIAPDPPPWWGGLIHGTHRQALLYKAIGTKHERWYLETLKPTLAELELVIYLKRSNTKPLYYWPV